MLLASLTLNLIVLVPVSHGLWRDRPWVAPVYGPDTSARRILLSAYGAIALLSLALLLRPDPRLAAGLLLFQVVYKLISVPALRDFRHPVLQWNVAVAAFHTVTLALIYRAIMG
ncbi:MAG: hypothetical protein AAFU65_15700 [Pseudomonadota bacterium]